MKDGCLYLQHILECIAFIYTYTVEGRSALDDPMKLDAVVRRLQVMAESTFKISEERKAAYPDVGWQHIRNFRNRLVHQYLDIDVDLPWPILESSLPPLKLAVEAMLAENP